MKKKYLVQVGLVLAVCLAGCQSRIDLRGKDFDPKVLTALKPGVTTQEDILRLVGSPSTKAAFEDNVWVYAYKVTETTSFFEPKVIESSVVRISFDKSGVVQEITHLDSQGHLIEPVRRVTKSALEEKSWAGQIFGNFGRQRKKKDKDEQ